MLVYWRSFWRHHEFDIKRYLEMQIIILINYLPFKQSNETLLLGSFKRNLDFLISWFWSLYLTKPRWHVKVTLSSMLRQATSDDNISLRKKHFFKNIIKINVVSKKINIQKILVHLMSLKFNLFVNTI